MLVARPVLMVDAARLYPSEGSVVGFVLAVFGLSAALIAICWRKVQPTGWRCG